MKPSPYYERPVHVTEELYRFMLLVRDRSDYRIPFVMRKCGDDLVPGRDGVHPTSCNFVIDQGCVQFVLSSSAAIESKACSRKYFSRRPSHICSWGLSSGEYGGVNAARM